MTENETDILAKFRAQGWVPPSEQPEYQKKWKEAQDAHWPFQKQPEKTEHE